MELFIWILLGLIAGGIVSMFMGRYSLQGIITDTVLGTIGALVGGLILNIISQPGETGFNIYSIAIAGFGAIALIWLGKMINTPTT